MELSRVESTYARWLAACTGVSLAALAASFLAYVLGIVEPLVPLARLPGLWRLPADEFVAATGAPVGWSWVGRLGWGDYANVGGVAMLCSVTLVCYARVLPALDRRAAVIAALQLLVLAAAASGLFVAGH